VYVLRNSSKVQTRVQNVSKTMKILGRINVLKNGYDLQFIETLKTSMLKIEPMWKRGRGNTYFNDIFCVFVCVCVCVCGD
jgi:hypothetical protein